MYYLPFCLCFIDLQHRLTKHVFSIKKIKFTLNKIVSKIVEKVGKTVKNRAKNGFFNFFRLTLFWTKKRD